MGLLNNLKILFKNYNSLFWDFCRRVKIFQAGCRCSQFNIVLSAGTGGGSDRPGDIKDVLDIEKLQLNDHTSKASKTQVCV